MGKSNEKIDFVITWLDGADPQWVARKDEAYKKLNQPENTDDDANSACRYRDMGALQYWFRGVEKFAPWVNKIYFVTCGQKPEWLNENHPKLVLVNHDEYMPADYLPTFNSIPIELNLHKISSLSEHFVLFNDDMFLINPVAPEYFFKNGEPVLPASLNICRYYGNNHWSKVCLNTYCTVNERLDIKKLIKENHKKWFNLPALGVKESFMNYLRYKINKTFSVNSYEHIAYPHLKSTMKEVWSECHDILDATCKSQFRSNIQVNHWLMLAWNLAKGRFHPVRSGKRGVFHQISKYSIGSIVDTIKYQKIQQICINDSWMNDNPELYYKEIKQAFEDILPKKSEFEKL